MNCRKAGGGAKMKALILIDIQEMYFTPGDYLLTGPKEAAENAAKILGAFREKGLPVIFVKHLFGAHEAISDIVAPLAGEPVVEKEYPNSFLKTDLKKQLDAAGADELVVVGMMTHMCVDTTVRAAQDYGYAVTLIGDACATKDLTIGRETITAPNVQKAFLAAIDGTFADVVNADDFKL
jgi:nicotinamidase-related amidase